MFEGNVEVRHVYGKGPVESLRQGDGVMFTESSLKLESYRLSVEDYKRWDEIVPAEDSSETVNINDETGPSSSFEKEVE